MPKKKPTLKFDVYENDECTTVILHGKKDSDCIRFIRTIEGKDYNDCMKQHHELMGWEPYKPF